MNFDFYKKHAFKILYCVNLISYKKYDTRVDNFLVYIANILFSEITSITWYQKNNLNYVYVC